MAVNPGSLTVLLIARTVPVDGHPFIHRGSSYLVLRVTVISAVVIALELVWRGAAVMAGIFADLIASRRSEHAIASIRADWF